MFREEKHEREQKKAKKDQDKKIARGYEGIGDFLSLAEASMGDALKGKAKDAFTITQRAVHYLKNRAEDADSPLIQMISEVSSGKIVDKVCAGLIGIDGVKLEGAKIISREARRILDANEFDPSLYPSENLEKLYHPSKELIEIESDGIALLKILSSLDILYETAAEPTHHVMKKISDFMDDSLKTSGKTMMECNLADDENWQKAWTQVGNMLKPKHKLPSLEFNEYDLTVTTPSDPYVPNRGFQQQMNYENVDYSTFLISNEDGLSETANPKKLKKNGIEPKNKVGEMIENAKNDVKKYVENEHGDQQQQLLVAPVIPWEQMYQPKNKMGVRVNQSKVSYVDRVKRDREFAQSTEIRKVSEKNQRRYMQEYEEFYDRDDANRESRNISMEGRVLAFMDEVEKQKEEMVFNIREREGYLKKHEEGKGWFGTDHKENAEKFNKRAVKNDCAIKVLENKIDSFLKKLVLNEPTHRLSSLDKNFFGSQIQSRRKHKKRQKGFGGIVRGVAHKFSEGLKYATVGIVDLDLKDPKKEIEKANREIKEYSREARLRELLREYPNSDGENLRLSISLEEKVKKMKKIKPISIGSYENKPIKRREPVKKEKGLLRTRKEKMFDLSKATSTFVNDFPKKRNHMEASSLLTGLPLKKPKISTFVFESKKRDSARSEMISMVRSRAHSRAVNPRGMVSKMRPSFFPASTSKAVSTISTKRNVSLNHLKSRGRNV